MTQQTSNGHKRLRKMFGKIHEVAEMPNLIEVQKQSYDQFLMVEEPEGGRQDEGLKIQRNRATALVNHGAGGCELRRVA